MSSTCFKDFLKGQTQTYIIIKRKKTPIFWLKNKAFFYRISLASARVSDTGNYTCRLGSVPSEIRQKYHRLQDTIVVHVLEGDITKAIHHSAGTRLKPKDQILLLLLQLQLLLILCSSHGWFWHCWIDFKPILFLVPRHATSRAS